LREQNQQFKQAGKKVGGIPRPIPAPKRLPNPGKLTLDFTHEQPEQTPDLNSSHRNSDDASYAQIAGPNNDFSVPTLSELGVKPATTPHRGGETIALQMLDTITEDEEYTSTFSKPDTAPTAFSPQSTTLLSPHLHFGSVSVREFYWRVQDVVDAYNKKGKNKSTQPPTSLTGQLLFREMYFAAHASLGRVFSQAMSNPTCRFIPWHLPSELDSKTGMATGSYKVDDERAEQWFHRWKNGITGFPWIDALMRQLKTEGWIHHLGRHAVACFLTRGGCYIHWERGAEVFEEFLIDHETACNAGNWQWLSCTAFFSQFFRVYSPIAFPKKTDKEGAFVRKYVPELAGFDEKFIYEPWKAPIADQKKWGCIVKGDGSSREVSGLRAYPKPMFDFAERRDVCLKGMKEAYHVALFGDADKVLDGTWKELFDGASEGLKGIGGEERITDVDADYHFEEDFMTIDHEIDEQKEENTGKGSGLKRKATVSKGQTTLDGLVKRTKK
jgi:cryptochrome